MLSLILMRHGQAAPEGTAPAGDARARDHKRPLTPRGEAEAVAVGRRLGEILARPTLIFASDARRARHTAELVLAGLAAAGPAPELRFTPALYLAGPSVYVATIGAAAAGHRALLVVGHNPGISVLGAALAGEDVELGTAEVLRLQLDAADWPTALAMTGAWEAC